VRHFEVKKLENIFGILDQQIHVIFTDRMMIDGKCYQLYRIHYVVRIESLDLSFIFCIMIIIGPAVTLDDKDSLYVFGGYDLLSGNVLFRNDFLQLEDLTSKKYRININLLSFPIKKNIFRWTKLTNTFNIKNKSQTVVPRARALLVACGDDVISPDGGLFACGGYNKSSSGELLPVPEILCYDKSTKDWIYLSEIPDLKKLNIFAVDNNILIISEKIKSDEEEDELIPVSKYDLVNRKWLMINRKEISNSQIETNE
jgi:hypothetical protein